VTRNVAQVLGRGHFLCGGNNTKDTKERKKKKRRKVSYNQTKPNQQPRNTIPAVLLAP